MQAACLFAWKDAVNFQKFADFHSLAQEKETEEELVVDGPLFNEGMIGRKVTTFKARFLQGFDARRLGSAAAAGFFGCAIEVLSLFRQVDSFWAAENESDRHPRVFAVGKNVDHFSISVNRSTPGTASPQNGADPSSIGRTIGKS